jgi:acetyl esterase
VAVVFLEYSRSPEARYPAALEECYEAAAWTAAHGAGLGVDGSRLAVCGDSAGANLATGVARLAKRRGGPPIRLQLLFFPVTDAAMNTPSYDEFADGYFLTRAQMRWFWDAYAPDLSARADPMLSPLRASPEDLRGLPEAVVLTADHDVLRDEGEAYARKLADAGVRVTATRYPGTIHAFVVLNALAGDPSPRDAIADAASALRRALAVRPA